jgi:hypothetical protein
LRRVTQVRGNALGGTIPLAKSWFDEIGQISAGRIRSLEYLFSPKASMTMFAVHSLSNKNFLLLLTSTYRATRVL